MRIRRENRREFDAKCLGERSRLVVEHRTRARLDLGDLRAGEGDILGGDPPAEIFLRNSRARSAANVAQASADDVARRLWFFALQNVLFRHIDETTFNALKGACRAHF